MYRNFDPQKKAQSELIEKLINAGKKAPSAGGLQDQVFTIIEDNEKMKDIKKVTFNLKFTINDASVISSNLEIVYERYGKRWIDFFLHKIVLHLHKIYYY